MIEPPEARQMLGRPPKNRRREIGEVRKAGKLPRMGTVMTFQFAKDQIITREIVQKILNLSLHQHPLKRYIHINLLL